MSGNKKTLIVLALLCGAFLIYYKKSSINIPAPDNPVIVVPEPVDPQPEPTVINACDSSLAEALLSKKPLLIIFWANWCGFCKLLKNDLANMKDIDRYVICLTDVDDPANKQLTSHFGIKMIPTAIMVDPKENKEIKRISGYDKTKFLSWLK